MLSHKRMFTLPAAVFCVVFGLLFMVSGVAMAHGDITVGDYELEIGFHVEPAYVGEPNGLDLFVTNTKTEEPVNGLEETLNVEIIRGSHKKTLELSPQFEQDGAYTASVLPTEVGDYTWHIWGDIEGTPVDVSMTSGPDTFGVVEDKSEIAFPETSGAAAQPDTALYVGIAGVLLGLAGTVIGLAGLRAARSKG